MHFGSLMYTIALVFFFILLQSCSCQAASRHLANSTFRVPVDFGCFLLFGSCLVDVTLTFGGSRLCGAVTLSFHPPKIANHSPHRV
jgi:hypothetical protein